LARACASEQEDFRSMSSVTTTDSKVISAPAAVKPAPQVQVAAPSRREFLYYIWGASIALLIGEAVVAIGWFALPRFKEGTFGGVFTISADKVPPLQSPPFNEPSGRFWVSNANAGLTVLFGVCTHLGCLPKWVEQNDRFECPCHGSKFDRYGQWLDGPAPRGLDRFPTIVNFTDGTSVEMSTNGNPIPLEGRQIASVQVDTGRRIKSDGRTSDFG
jgi:cytochrome b6-f complex iron-sulfur subunit